jgi:DNA-binding IclR family transcriptional regulator
LAIVAHIESSKAERLMCISSGNKDSQVSQCPIEKFRDRLAKVRRDGFAFCDEEYEPGLRALAVPVLRPTVLPSPALPRSPRVRDSVMRSATGRLLNV